MTSKNCLIFKTGTPQEPMTTTHIAHNAVIVVTITTVVFIIFSIPKFCVIRVFSSN